MGIRNRTWARLTAGERGLYGCALWVARARNKISNPRLMVHVLRIVMKLIDNFQSRIVNAGRVRAARMFEEYARPGGAFTWAPRMREWLNEGRYILYVGVLEVNS
jgi:hypothetical protein